MIFQRRFHSHTPRHIDTPPTPPPKDGVSPPKTIEEILAIAVSPRAPKPPPHAIGTVSSNPRIVKDTPARSASSPLKSTLPRRAPSSRKTGHATILTDPVGGHDAFESDAFAVHMPTTRIPIIDRPIRVAKRPSPTKAQAEAVQTYKEKAQEARDRNNSIGVRVPPNIASYDYAYASTTRHAASESPKSKSPTTPPAPAGAFPISPPVPQTTWTQHIQKPEPVLKTSKISSNTSVFRKPNILGVTTAAAVIKESVEYVRVDANGGASRPSSPPKSTTVKISMKPRVPTIKVEPCQAATCQSEGCQVEHCRGIYYRSPHLETIPSSRSPSPTKTMPKFERQYSVEGDSIFGYKIKDPFGTIAGANNSSSSEDEKPKAAPKTLDVPQRPGPKRTLADRWPWIRKGATAGKPPQAPAPDPPVKAPTPRRESVYVSPFEALVSPPKTPPPPITPTPLRHAVSTRTASLKKSTVAARSAPILTAPVSTPPTSTHFDTGFAQIQSLFLLTVKIGFALYAVVALWFILDAIREALCVVCVPFRLLGHIVGFVWAVVSFFGRSLGVAADGLNGKVRVLGR